MSKNTVNIGTSGWNYKHWYGNFYPDDMKEKDFLKYYSNIFHTVEVNNTFYHLPQQKTIKTWTDTVSDNFRFSIKASRYITHMKKLKDPEESIVNFFERIQCFKDKTGPILFQFSPRWSFNPERLGNFINTLPKHYKYTFEFRDPNWFNELTYNFLKDNNIAFCIYYMGEDESPKEVTADFIYIRFHGSNSLGSGGYSEDRLKEFARNIKEYRDQGKDVYCYFNNDEEGLAVKNAKELRGLIENAG